MKKLQNKMVLSPINIDLINNNDNNNNNLVVCSKQKKANHNNNNNNRNAALLRLDDDDDENRHINDDYDGSRKDEEEEEYYNNNHTHYYHMGDSTYRHDGVSIGPDYFRCEDFTVNRGDELIPSALLFDGTIGRGAFSKVQRAIWTTTTTNSTSITTRDTNDNDNDIATDKNNKNKKRNSATRMIMKRLRKTTKEPPKNRDIQQDDNNDNEENNNEKSNKEDDNNKQKKKKKKQKNKVLVAVKQTSLLDSSTEVRQMLIKELRALCRVDCPCLLKLHGAFLEQDTVTMVLEYMDRGSLEHVLQQQKQEQQSSSNNNTASSFLLQERTIACIGYQILWGLSYLHYDRLLHRDIKPGNILCNSLGYIKLCDFGLASIGDKGSLSSSSLCHTTFVGTTKFMAPERFKAGQKYGRSSDMWSVGLVLLQCLTGEPPWKEITSLIDLVVTMDEITDDDDDPLFVRNLLLPTNQEESSSSSGRISSGLYEIILGCLQKDPAKRIPASVLLQSPWFSNDENGIHNLDDAIQRIDLFR